MMREEGRAKEGGGGGGEEKDGYRFNAEGVKQFFKASYSPVCLIQNDGVDVWEDSIFAHLSPK